MVSVLHHHLLLLTNLERNRDQQQRNRVGRIPVVVVINRYFDTLDTKVSCNRKPQRGNKREKDDDDVVCHIWFLPAHV